MILKDYLVSSIFQNYLPEYGYEEKGEQSENPASPVIYGFFRGNCFLKSCGVV